MQSAECRVKGAPVGAIHESPENERISVCFISTGRGGVIFAKQIYHGAKRSLLASSRNERISRIKAGEHSSPLRKSLKFFVGDDVLDIPKTNGFPCA